MSQTRVLVVDDEPGIVLTVEDRLTAEGYAVATATDGIQGYEAAVTNAFDVIVLDLMLPGKDGITVCHDLRSAGIHTPIIMLTAKGRLTDKVVGLKMGADDYLTKPFEMAELCARVEALARRVNRATPAPADRRDDERFVTFGPFRLDAYAQELLRDNTAIRLSTQEFRLLKYFVDHPGKVIDRDELLDHVWGYDSLPSTRTVDVHVAWLRQKLGDNDKPRLIITIRGRGYKFVKP